MSGTTPRVFTQLKPSSHHWGYGTVARSVTQISAWWLGWVIYLCTLLFKTQYQWLPHWSREGCSYSCWPGTKSQPYVLHGVTLTQGVQLARQCMTYTYVSVCMQGCLTIIICTFMWCTVHITANRVPRSSRIRYSNTSVRVSGLWAASKAVSLVDVVQLSEWISHSLAVMGPIVAEWLSEMFNLRPTSTYPSICHTYTCHP